MKKGVLILIGIIMMVSTVEAKNGNELPNRFGFVYSYDNAVNFEERGVEFFVFTNGEFDFNTNYNDSYYDYNGNRRRGNRGVNIDRDYRGRINRIGNAFINYDRNGNVTRIGNVFMRYYRGQLTNVGNLRVRYNYWGNPTFYGAVKNNYYNYNGFRINLNIGDICDYNDDYFYRNDFRTNYTRVREDRNYYYYRANPNAKIGKRSKTLRRRKPASSLKNRKSLKTKRRNNTSYRRPSTLNKKGEVTRRKANDRRPSSVNTKRSSTLNKRNTSTTSRRTATVIKRKITPVKRKVVKTIKKRTSPKTKTAKRRRS